MRQTEKFLLNLIDVTDMLSLKPLNENMEKVEAALLAQQISTAGKLMMATGTYTGDGSRSVTIQTPGFKPKAMILTSVNGVGWDKGVALWGGDDVGVRYTITAAYEEGGVQYDSSVNDTIHFSAEHGKLTWSLPPLSDRYHDITRDDGPNSVNNSSSYSYLWIAFGTAE